jgi:hypothetical protein
MKKLINIWFEAESYTVKLSSREYVITVLKYIGTILQLLLCTIIFIFLLILRPILFGIDKISTLKLHKSEPKPKTKEPFKPLTPGYNKHGYPENLKRPDGPISEKEYENMRKVL